MTELDAITLLRADVALAGGQRAWARAHGKWFTELNEILRGKRKLSPSIGGEIGLMVVRDWRVRPAQKE